MAGLWLVMALGAGTAYVAAGLPDTEGLWHAQAGPSIVVLDASGRTLATQGVVRGDDVRLAEMSPYLPLAVLAAEDRRFYAHWGIDAVGLVRAALANLHEGRIVQGGSTITQQLAKNVFLTPERTFKRKFQEALLALWLEWRFSKDEILTLYLNRVYLGAGTYGVEAAARRYFDKSPATLGLAESAMIAGLLKAPSRFSPTNDPTAAIDRTRLVLDTMLEAGFITAQTRQGVDLATLRLAQGMRSRGAQYFVDWVLDSLPALIGPAKGELIIETTLHLPYQRRAEAAVERRLGEKGTSLAASEAALVTIDRTGAIRAMVGGRAFEASQFNRATRAQRQPGSAFKPFVFLAAVERGRTPQWRVLDAPIRLANWAPANFEADYRGDVTLQTALALSLNSATVRLGERVGREAVINIARRLGILSPLDAVPSLALGTEEVNLLELTGAYVPFATGGVAPPVHAITRIRGRDGRLLYGRPRGAAARVIAPPDAGAMNAMLKAVVDWGTGRAARLDGREVGGKTGTSQDFRDAWFIGFTADLVTGVWVGNDNGKPMKRVTGGSLPAEIWHDFMAEAAAVYPVRPLPSGGYRPVSETRVATAPAGTAEPPTEKPGRLMTFFERIGSVFGNSERPDEPGARRRQDDGE